LLRFGLAGMTGLGLTDLLRLQTVSAAAGSKPPDTAVILVWCHGGASHLDTYDPKPDAPTEYRGPFTAIDTNVPGVRVSNLMPKQARIADKYALIRSVRHRAFCHQQGLQTLWSGHEELVLKNKPEHPDCFCVLDKVRSRPRDVLPVHVGLPPLPYSGPAYLGPAYEPFSVGGDPNQPTFEVPNIRLAEGARTRLDRRLKLMHGIDGIRRDFDADPQVGARDQQYHAAVDLLTSSHAREAFDLSREATSLRDKYGRTRWGQSMLLARRLVEAGVGAVVVSLFGVENAMIGNWDDHAVNADCFKAMEQRAPVFDQGVAALISDVFDRGLDRKVMVIVTGEFGRTPKVNQADAGRPGRDHWPHAMSILVAGGGVKGGQVIGATDARGEFVEERPLDPNDLTATLYQHLGVDPTTEFNDHSGRPIRILDRTGRIPELF
jgi:uncharacterized protein (DUF1501 family)